MSRATVVQAGYPDPDPVPDVKIDVVVPVPDTVHLGEQFHVYIKVVNLEDTTVVVDIKEWYFDPEYPLQPVVRYHLDRYILPGQTWEREGVDSPHTADYLGVWRFGGWVADDYTGGYWGIIDRDLEEVFVVE